VGWGDECLILNSSFKKKYKKIKLHQSTDKTSNVSEQIILEFVTENVYICVYCCTIVGCCVSFVSVGVVRGAAAIGYWLIKIDLFDFEIRSFLRFVRFVDAGDFVFCFIFCFV